MLTGLGQALQRINPTKSVAPGFAGNYRHVSCVIRSPSHFIVHKRGVTTCAHCKKQTCHTEKNSSKLAVWDQGCALVTTVFD